MNPPVTYSQNSMTFFVFQQRILTFIIKYPKRKKKSDTARVQYPIHKVI